MISVEAKLVSQYFDFQVSFPELERDASAARLSNTSNAWSCNAIIALHIVAPTHGKTPWQNAALAKRRAGAAFRPAADEFTVWQWPDPDVATPHLA